MVSGKEHKKMSIFTQSPAERNLPGNLSHAGECVQKGLFGGEEFPNSNQSL